MGRTAYSEERVDLVRPIGGTHRCGSCGRGRLIADAEVGGGRRCGRGEDARALARAGKRAREDVPHALADAARVEEALLEALVVALHLRGRALPETEVGDEPRDDVVDANPARGAQ